MIEIGSLDWTTFVVGEKGVGKSTWLKLDALGFQRRTGGFVLIHSPRGQIGTAPYIVMSDNVDKLRKALRRHPDKIHVVTDGDPETVVDYGVDLAYALRKRAHDQQWPPLRFRDNRPAPKGLKATPVSIVIDEGTHMAKGITRDEQAALEKFLTSLRHSHIAMTMAIQAPTARAWVFAEQASRFRLFRYMHEWGLNSVRAAAIDQEVIEVMREIPKFTYYAFDKDTPEKAGWHRLPDPM